MSDRGRAAAAAFAVAASLWCLGGCGPEPPGETQPPAQDVEYVPGRPVPKPQVAIETDHGRIELELFTDAAPRHVDQFLELVAEGFYDGTTFHRVVPGFLIQGGDPNTKDDDPENDGYGGLEARRLPLEIAGHLSFRRGTLGMARDYRSDGASCQFFITVGRASHLDGEYTIFGKVIGGLDVLDAIAGLEVDERRRPLEPTVVRRMWVAADPRKATDSGDAESQEVAASRQALNAAEVEHEEDGDR